MTRYEEFTAVMTKLDWTYDGANEVWRDRDGQMIDPANVLAALPDAAPGEPATWDELAAWGESMWTPVGRS